MPHPEANLNLWSLTSSQLAAECRAIAEGDTRSLDPELKDEVVRLYAGWREALEQPGNEFDDRTRKAARLAALRKRTIEILVRIRGVA